LSKNICFLSFFAFFRILASTRSNCYTAMRRLIKILFFINLMDFGYGLYLQYILHNKIYNKVMGFGVLFMVFVLLPLFLYDRYKDKNIEDYRFKGFKDKNDTEN